VKCKRGGKRGGLQGTKRIGKNAKKEGELTLGGEEAHGVRDLAVIKKGVENGENGGGETNKRGKMGRQKEVKKKAAVGCREPASEGKKKFRRGG